MVAADPSAIAVPLDHVAIHRCRAVTRRLGEHPQVRLVFGPRSCPHHHPVERIWGAMKIYLANTPVETMAGRVGQVRAFFRERSQEQRLRRASPFRSPRLPEGSAQNVWEAA
jgi:transposase